MMNPYLKANQQLWNEWTRLHVVSPLYDVEGFKAGKNPLDSVVRQGVGDVQRRSLLHLQCHFGIDTLSWARLGANVTGIDFSEQAIAQACALASELDIPATFIQSNIYELPNVLGGQFDIVFTSHGVLSWLPDLAAWGRIVAHFLKPGGLFFIAEAHPFPYVFDDEDSNDLKIRYPYFHTDTPFEFHPQGSYASSDTSFQGVEYGWQYSLEDVIGGLLGAGLQIQEFHEYPFLSWQMFKFMEKDTDGWWRLPGRFPPLPLMFTIKATR